MEATGQRKNDRVVRDTIRSLNSKIDDFEANYEYQLKSSSADQEEIDYLRGDVRQLKDSLNDFESNLDARRENMDDVTRVIDSASTINGYLITNPQNGRIDDDWAMVRSLINRLSSNYGIAPDWKNTSRTTAQIYPNASNRTGQSYPNNPNRNALPKINTSAPRPKAPRSTSSLTGTYRLDPTRSESIDQIITDAGVGAANRQDLQDRLEAPQELALDISGNRVVLASSKSSPVTLTADGSEKTEQDAAGRTIRLRATLRGSELVISSLGGETDYTVTFTSQDNGRTLKVTRRITTDYLNQTVFADSIYTKTNDIAGLGIKASSADEPDSSADSTSGGYSSNDPNDRNGSSGSAPSVSPARSGEFIVPNGTIITGMLENTIDTKVSMNNDRFKLTIQSPMDLRGATIEGYITGVGRSGRVSGSSNITFNFETITLRNGQKYDFSGYLQGIKDQNGKVVKVDTEGTAKGDSQTKETVKRGGLGAGAGAILGAILGGGKGAAIGAIIGGGAGAGSVVVQGRDDIQLMKGSTLTIQASSPIKNEQAKDSVE
jgi:uncharacterized protein YqeY